MIGNGNARNIHQLERPHSDPEGGHGRLINGGNICDALFQNARRLIQPGDKEPVDSKPGSVFDQDVCFSRELGKLPAG